MFWNEPATTLPLDLSRLALANQGAPAAMQYASDGARLWWGDVDTPASSSPGKPVSVIVAVSPVRPGYSVAVEHRVNGGPVRQAIAAPEFRADRSNALIFRALLPGQPSGTVEFLPVLRFAGQSISPASASRPSARATASPAPRTPSRRPTRRLRPALDRMHPATRRNGPAFPCNGACSGTGRRVHCRYAISTPTLCGRSSW